MALTKAALRAIRRHLKPGDYAIVAAKVGLSVQYVRMVATGSGRAFNQRVIDQLVDQGIKNKNASERLTKRIDQLKN